MTESFITVRVDQMERLLALARDGKTYRRLIAESEAIGPAPKRGSQ